MMTLHLFSLPSPFYLCKQSKIEFLLICILRTCSITFKHSLELLLHCIKAQHIFEVLLHCIGKLFTFYLFDMHTLPKQFIGIDTLQLRVRALFFQNCLVSLFSSLELRVRALFLCFVPIGLVQSNEIKNCLLFIF